MEKKAASKKTYILAAAALVVLAVVFALVYQTFRPKGAEGGKHITIQVIYEDETSKDFTCQTEAQYLGEVLKNENLVEGTEGEYGLYILTVDGVTVDDSKQQWWKLTEGGELTNYSADQLPIKDGGHYELTFTTGWD